VSRPPANRVPTVRTFWITSDAHPSCPVCNVPLRQASDTKSERLIFSSVFVSEMAEPLFFKSAKALTVAEIATLTRAPPAADAPLNRIINHIASLDAAGPGDLAFLDNPKYVDDLAVTHAGACLLAARYAGRYRLEWRC
jgi:hypothetical protein